jgi:hypothetical protein
MQIVLLHWTLGQLFHSISDCMHAMHLECTILPNLELKTRPKQPLGPVSFRFACLSHFPGLKNRIDRSRLVFIITTVEEHIVDTNEEKKEWYTEACTKKIFLKS